MIQQMIQKIYIRPLKQKYFSHDLGPKCYSFDPQSYTKKRKSYRTLNAKASTKVNSNSPSPKKQNKISKKKIKRQDHIISSPNTQKLQLSFYTSEQPLEQKVKQFKLTRLEQTLTNKTQTKKIKQITIVYLHTHNGSRLEGLSLVEPVLSLGVNFCTFDFSGYGNSSGNEVSLGIRQVYDLQRVLQFLEETYEQIGFILWGRSMGAVTALRYLGSQLHQEDDFNILAAIYDSPFCSLQKLTYEMSSKALNLPQSLLKPLVMIIKSTLSQKVPFQKLQLQDLMKSITVPGIFISSKNDTFISHEHSDRLYSKYESKQKQILFVESNHNESRKFNDLIKVYDFIEKIVGLYPNKQSIVINNLLKLTKSQREELFQVQQNRNIKESPQQFKVSKKVSLMMNQFLFD